MMDPRYREVRSNQIPETVLDSGVNVRIICGDVNGITGPVKDIVIDPEYLDITVPSGSSFEYTVKRGYTVFAYVIEGEGYFDQGRDSYAHEVEGTNYFDFGRDCLVGSENLVIFGDGESVAISSQNRPLRFLFVSGKPIGEPVAWYGPIVMNTREELRIAFEEYENGTFIKDRESGAS
jgi:hypothetical protein